MDDFKSLVFSQETLNSWQYFIKEPIHAVVVFKINLLIVNSQLLFYLTYALLKSVPLTFCIK